LPNCVGYAWGRFCEGGGVTYCNLSRNNASTFWGRTSDGYSRGQTPAVGAVVCYAGGRTGAGHVEIVEQVNSDGSYISSASDYSGRWWYRSTRWPGRNLGNLIWQGFIYNPYVDGAEPSPPDPGPEPDPPEPSQPITWRDIAMYNIITKSKKRRNKIL